jgi:hypothetical protein
VEAVVELLAPLPLRHHVVDLAAAVAAGRRRLGVLLLLPAAAGGAGQRRGPLRPHGKAAAPDRHVAGVARLHYGGLRGRGVVLAQRRRRGLGGGGRCRGDDGHHGAHERLVLAGGERVRRGGCRRGVRVRRRGEEARGRRGGQGGVVELEEGGRGAPAVDGEGALGGERRGRVHRMLLLVHQVVVAAVLREEAARVHAVRRRRLSAGGAAGEVDVGDAEARCVGGEEAGGAAEQQITTKAKKVRPLGIEQRAIELPATSSERTNTSTRTPPEPARRGRGRGGRRGGRRPAAAAGRGRTTLHP